jgi:hypothetical protein
MKIKVFMVTYNSNLIFDNKKLNCYNSFGIICTDYPFKFDKNEKV